MTPNALFEWVVHHSFPILLAIGVVILIAYLWSTFNQRVKEKD